MSYVLEGHMSHIFPLQSFRCLDPASVGNLQRKIASCHLVSSQSGCETLVSPCVLCLADADLESILPRPCSRLAVPSESDSSARVCKKEIRAMHGDARQF